MREGESNWLSRRRESLSLQRTSKPEKGRRWGGGALVLKYCVGRGQGREDWDGKRVRYTRTDGLLRCLAYEFGTITYGTMEHWR